MYILGLAALLVAVFIAIKLFKTPVATKNKADQHHKQHSVGLNEESDDIKFENAEDVYVFPIPEEKPKIIKTVKAKKKIKKPVKKPIKPKKKSKK